VLRFIRKSAAGVFDPETVSLLVGAFDDAWESLISSGAPFAQDRYQATAREIIAKHIVDLARLGERDRRRLTESALLELSRVNLKRLS
jgi:hypothetical protein